MKASPGGILLIGVGVLLLSLGWTGRFAAVWDAIRGSSGGGKTGDETGEDTEEPSGTECSDERDCPTGKSCRNGRCVTPSNDGRIVCQGGTRRILIPSLGNMRCIRENQLASPENGSCRGDYTLGYEIVNQNNPDDTSKPVCVRSVSLVGGGEVIDYSYSEMPTGVIGLRYGPNAR